MFQQVLGKNYAERMISLCAIAVAFLVFVPGGSVVADEAAQPVQDQVTVQTEVTPLTVQQDSMRVYKDPETGRLMAPPQHVREALAAQADKQRQDLNQSAEGLQARVHRNGMVTMDLEGRFQSHYMVTRSEDGQLQHFCTEGELAFFEKLIANHNAQKNAETQEVANDR